MRHILYIHKISDMSAFIFWRFRTALCCNYRRARGGGQKKCSVLLSHKFPLLGRVTLRSVRKLRESQGFRKKCTGPSACQPKMTMALAQLWVTITPSATSRPVFVFLIGAGGAPRSVIDVSFRRALLVHFALVLEGELTRHLVDSLAAWNLQKEKGVDCIAFESKKVSFFYCLYYLVDYWQNCIRQFGTRRTFSGHSLYLSIENFCIEKWNFF